MGIAGEKFPSTMFSGQTSNPKLITEAPDVGKCPGFKQMYKTSFEMFDFSKGDSFAPQHKNTIAILQLICNILSYPKTFQSMKLHILMELM